MYDLHNEERTPYRLSEMIKSMLFFFTIRFVAFCSLYMQYRNFGICISIDIATPIFELYQGENDFRFIALRLGKVFLSISRELPLPLMMTSCLWSISQFIIGISRVACPNPQSNGETNIFIFVFRNIFNNILLHAFE